jgi:hypothetical protein
VLRPLAEDEADAARRGMDQDRIARLDAIEPAHEILRGQAAQQPGRRHPVVDVGRQADQAVGRHQPHLAVGAHGAGIGDAVADRDPGRALAQGFDDADPWTPRTNGIGSAPGSRCGDRCRRS